VGQCQCSRISKASSLSILSSSSLSDEKKTPTSTCITINQSDGGTDNGTNCAKLTEVVATTPTAVIPSSQTTGSSDPAPSSSSSSSSLSISVDNNYNDNDGVLCSASHTPWPPLSYGPVCGNPRGRYVYDYWRVHTLRTHILHGREPLTPLEPPDGQPSLDIALDGHVPPTHSQWSSIVFRADID
jgi:hypothetical protein